MRIKVEYADPMPGRAFSPAPSIHPELPPESRHGGMPANANARAKSVAPPPRRSLPHARAREATPEPEEVDDAETAYAKMHERYDSDADSEDDDSRHWKHRPDLGEFIDNEGHKLYQVSWYNWMSKKTGLATTWIDADQFKLTASSVVEAHERQRRKERLDKADASGSVDLSEVCSRLWHSIGNREIQSGLLEKLDSQPFYNPKDDWRALPEGKYGDVEVPTDDASTPARVGRPQSGPASTSRRRTRGPSRPRPIYNDNGTKFVGRARTPEGMPYPIRTGKYKDISARRPGTSSASAANAASSIYGSYLAPIPKDRMRISRDTNARDPFNSSRDVIQLDEYVDMDEPDEDGIRRGNRRAPPPL